MKEGQTTKATYFLYSDTGLMGEANEQGQLTKAYAFNPVKAQQGLWSTDPVWQAEAAGGSLTAQSSSFHYLHTDHLGTPILATDKLGSTNWTAVAESFGATGVLQSSSIAMNLRFPGQYWDGETGNHYNFHRDYKASMGRYLKLDPLGMHGGINFFVYANNNPRNEIDPMGLKSGGDPTITITDWAKDNACKKGCDWVYKKCRETWMRFCISFGKSTACAELCEIEVPDICAREKAKRCPDPVACNGSTGGDFA